MKFVLLLLCCGLISTQAIPTSDLGNSELAKILKELIVVVTGILDKVNSILNQAVSILSKGGLDDFQKKTVEVTLKVLDWAAKGIFDLIKKHDSELNADAKKVVKCAEDNAKTIENLIVSFYNTSTICWNPKLKPLLVSLQPLLTDLTKLNKDVSAMAPELDKCNNDACVIVVTLKVIKSITSIPDVVKKDIPAIKTAAITFYEAAKACVLTNAPIWIKNAIPVLNSISTCMRK